MHECTCLSNWTNELGYQTVPEPYSGFLICGRKSGVGTGFPGVLIDFGPIFKPSSQGRIHLGVEPCMQENPKYVHLWAHPLQVGSLRVEGRCQSFTILLIFRDDYFL